MRKQRGEIEIINENKGLTFVLQTFLILIYYSMDKFSNCTLFKFSAHRTQDLDIRSPCIILSRDKTVREKKGTRSNLGLSCEGIQVRLHACFHTIWVALAHFASRTRWSLCGGRFVRSFEVEFIEVLYFLQFALTLFDLEVDRALFVKHDMPVKSLPEASPEKTDVANRPASCKRPIKVSKEVTCSYIPQRKVKGFSNTDRPSSTISHWRFWVRNT